jgi:hypothetical protein
MEPIKEISQLLVPTPAHYQNKSLFNRVPTKSRLQ